MKEDHSNILICVGDSIVEGLHIQEVAGFTLLNAGISGAGVPSMPPQASTTQRYTHLAPDTLRKAAFSLQGKLNQKPANVIPFHKAEGA